MKKQLDEGGTMKSPRQVRDYRLLFHDTGDQLFRMAWPPTRESFIDAFIIDDFPSKGIIQELQDNLPDFRLAYEEDGLSAAEMRSFGPCLKLEQYFLDGFDDLLKFIRSRKK